MDIYTPKTDHLESIRIGVEIVPTNAIKDYYLRKAQGLV